jgi:hypothetical protein
MPDGTMVLAGILLGALAVAAFLAGRSSNRLAWMELSAAINVAKQEVGWEYQRYRIQALRMDWMALDPVARQEYVRRWGRPKWAGTAKSEPLEGVTAVRSIRGPVP